MALLSREQILEAPDLPYEDVDVPEWGGTVRVRGLTGAERDQFEAAILERQRDGRLRVRMENIRARLVALACVDEEGERLFSEQDVAALGRKSAVALQRVFEVAQRLSGLAPQDLEELAKNSGSARRGASTSA